MNLTRVHSIADLRALAARRLPDFILDFIEGGVEDEYGVDRNEQALRRYLLLPRLLLDVTTRTQRTTIFDKTYDSPFGIAPTGSSPLYRHNADFLLANAAASANIPFVLSGVSGADLESIQQAAPLHAWYQVYGARERRITQDVVKRAAAAGFDVLVMPVDNPVTPKRERHLRSGATVPLKMTPRLMVHLIQQALFHPSWFIEFLANGGMPKLGTWARYAPDGSTNLEIAEFYRSQSPASQTWADFEMVRKLWPGKLVLKGVLNPNDASRAVALGADGVWVSNHGGKILDRAPATIDMLPLVREAVGQKARVFFDSGVRRGSDIVVAKCLGADMVFTGRAMLYGVAAAGTSGVAHAINILKKEIDLVQGTIGRPELSSLGADCILRSNNNITY